MAVGAPPTAGVAVGAPPARLAADGEVVAGRKAAAAPCLGRAGLLLAVPGRAACACTAVQGLAAACAMAVVQVQVLAVARAMALPPTHGSTAVRLLAATPWLQPLIVGPSRGLVPPPTAKRLLARAPPSFSSSCLRSPGPGETPACHECEPLAVRTPACGFEWRAIPLAGWLSGFEPSHIGCRGVPRGGWVGGKPSLPGAACSALGCSGGAPRVVLLGRGSSFPLPPRKARDTHTHGFATNIEIRYKST